MISAMVWNAGRYRRVVSWRIGRKPGTWYLAVLSLVIYVALFSTLSESRHTALLGACFKIFGPHGCGRPVTWCVTDLGKGLEVVTPEHPEYERVFETASYRVMYLSSVHTVGLVAPVYETADAWITVWPGDASRELPEAERMMVATLAVHALLEGRDSSGPVTGRPAELLRKGVLKDEWLVPWGAIHDVLFVGVAWAVLGGWWWMQLAGRIERRKRVKG